MNIRVTLETIQSKRRMEAEDEIYLKRDGVALRPSGSPDYWRFDRSVGVHRVEREVFTGGRAERTTLELWEQDTGRDSLLGTLVIRPHRRLDTIDWERGERYDTTYRGERDGLHVVMFHGERAIYYLAFRVETV